MKVTLRRHDIGETKTDTLVLFLLARKKEQSKAFKEIDRQLDGLLNLMQKNGDLSGEPGKVTVVYHNREKFKPVKVVVVGLGEEGKLSLDSFRCAAAHAVRESKARRGVSIAFAFPELSKGFTDEAIARALLEGAILADYRYARYRTSEKEDTAGELKEIHLVYIGKSQQMSKALTMAQVLAQAVCFTRDLCNEPGNILTPSELAKTAKKLAKECKLKCDVLDEARMKSLKMNALLAVSQGSSEPAKLITLDHHPKGAKNKKPIVLVGKGITFDTGGISIKPGQEMHKMKYDMSGGAVVMGIMKAVAQLNIPLHVIGIIPTSENMPDGKAYKPGDVITASNGKNIEIINTDAEGRMILADALVYAQRYKPGVIIDFATLTGACVVALGYASAGMVGTDSGSMDKLRRASETTGEKIWELPLFDEYKTQIKSSVADIKNTGGRAAGTLTAAAFLSHFVAEIPWVHLDIAGTAWAEKDSPYCSKGSTGFGVRLVVEALKNWR